MGQRGRPRHPNVLTPREQDVLALIRDGLTNEQIAERLNISFETAKSHVAEILSKLGVATREEAAAWQPEPEREPGGRRRSLGGVLLAAAGVAIVAAALAGIALLSWGVLQTGSTSVAAGWSDCPTMDTRNMAPGVYVMDADTCNITSVTNDAGAGALSWSPDGASIAYLRFGDGNTVALPTDIFVAATDGSGVRQLTDTPDVSEGDPVWSPDGRRIAYSQTSVAGASDSGQTPRSFDVVVQELASGRMTTVLSDIPCQPDYDWSPDANRLAVVLGCNGDNSLQIVNLTTGENTQVPQAEGLFGWQPIGGRLAYSCLSDQVYGICLTGPDGSLPGAPVMASSFPGPVQTGQPDSPILAYRAVWSSDGQTLAISGGNLYLLQMVGSAGTVVSGFPDAQVVWASANVVAAIGCDPSSGFLPCPLELVSQQLSTGDTRAVARFPCGGGGALWSPDGGRLAITPAKIGVCL